MAVFLLGLSATALSGPLFDGEATLSVIIEAPIRALVRQRLKEPEFAGTLRYTEASGEERALGLVITTRGNSRLEMCDFPPLKLKFNPDEIEGTLFEDLVRIELEF